MRLKILSALFALAALARIAVWVLLTREWVPVSDADQYVLLARSIADGHGFSLQFPQVELHPTAFRPPLFPLLLSPFAFVGGDALWPLRLATVLIGAANAPVSFVLVSKFGSRPTALIAALAVALYPPLLANDSVVLSEGLGLLLFQLALIAAISNRPLFLGLTLGMVVLTRPNAYLLIAVVLAYLGLKFGWKRCLPALVVLLVVITPWAIRNKVETGVFRLTTSEGFNLAAVYSPQAQEIDRFVDPVFHESFDDPKYRLSQFDEGDWNSLLSETGIEGLKSNPAYVVENGIRNAIAYFELDPARNVWAETVDGRNLRFRNASLPLFYVVTVIGLYGLWLNRRNNEVQLLAACGAQFVVLSMLFISVPRLRSPVDLILCIGVGLALEHFLGKRRELAPSEVLVGSARA